MEERVVFEVYYSMLTIYPASRVQDRLLSELTYQRVKPVYGYKAALTNRKFESTNCYLYEIDSKNDKIITFTGLLERAYNCLRGYGFSVEIKDDSEFKCYTPKFENISDVILRDGQIDILSSMVSCNYGQYQGATGLGKSMLISQYARLYPYPDYRILVCAQQRPVVTALYREISKYFPEETGITGCGHNDPKRITVTTSKSILKNDPSKVDCIIYDEVHTAGGEKISKNLIQFNKSKMYGLSASVGVRTDSADLAIEALFGPIRTRIELEDGQKEGYIPKVNAYFYKLDIPEVAASTTVAKKRKGIWRNSIWNNAISRIAKSWEEELDDPNILVMTDTLEHVLFLKQYLPDYEIIYASIGDEQISKFEGLGILPDDFVKLTDKTRAEKIRAFELGELKKVISTTTLGVGVDAPMLDVLIRADGGSSEISNIQRLVFFLP
jgi:superfamily II DNA or RNA helicase